MLQNGEINFEKYGNKTILISSLVVTVTGLIIYNFSKIVKNSQRYPSHILRHNISDSSAYPSPDESKE